MKLLLLSLLMTASTLSIANDICTQQLDLSDADQLTTLKLIDGHCAALDYYKLGSDITPHKYLKEFFKLENIVGSAVYDLHHINRVKIYRFYRGYKFQKSVIQNQALKAMTKFGIEELGIQSYEDTYDRYYDIMDVYRDGKEMNAHLFTKFIKKQLSELDLENGGYYQEEVESVMLEYKRKNEIYEQSVNQLVALMTQRGSFTVSVYPLVDNENENTQDAQWIVMGRNFIMLFNRFWWL
jgi:hypothetical protein